MKWEKAIEHYFKIGYYIVQGGYVVINDCAIFDVWTVELDADASSNKLHLLDANNMLMASIDSDLIKDIDIITMDENNEIIDK